MGAALQPTWCFTCSQTQQTQNYRNNKFAGYEFVCYRLIGYWPFHKCRYTLCQVIIINNEALFSFMSRTWFIS